MTEPLPLAAASSAESMRREAQALRLQSRVLAAQGPYEVLRFRGPEAPALMHEIGLRREEAFRAAGEGTGRSVDVDAWDGHYEQLLLWDEAEARVAGGYRIGSVRELVRAKGAAGLYSHSLFELKPALVAELDDALELGRSFISVGAQRDFVPLFLLWKGIAAWVCQLGDRPKLFGCVSISPSFLTITQRLMVRFLEVSSMDLRLSALVRPRNPELAQAWEGDDLSDHDLRQIEAQVSSLEQGKLGFPPLLKQYLKLGGKILAFNRDEGFNGTLDALILVDLRLSPRRLLERYLGAEECGRFLAMYRIVPSVAFPPLPGKIGS
jgi:putative hemolysin